MADPITTILVVGVIAWVLTRAIFRGLASIKYAITKQKPPWHEARELRHQTHQFDVDAALAENRTPSSYGLLGFLRDVWFDVHGVRERRRARRAKRPEWSTRKGFRGFWRRVWDEAWARAEKTILRWLEEKPNAKRTLIPLPDVEPAPTGPDAPPAPDSKPYEPPTAPPHSDPPPFRPEDTKPDSENDRGPDFTFFDEDDFKSRYRDIFDDIADWWDLLDPDFLHHDPRPGKEPPWWHDIHPPRQRAEPPVDEQGPIWAWASVERPELGPAPDPQPEPVTTTTKENTVTTMTTTGSPLTLDMLVNIASGSELAFSEGQSYTDVMLTLAKWAHVVNGLPGRVETMRTGVRNGENTSERFEQGLARINEAASILARTIVDTAQIHVEDNQMVHEAYVSNPDAGGKNYQLRNR
ncbi:hypothetical protein AB0I28_32725 [Phytomonospora sp. NPDC050363]|uniref:hypothetical protein n=1 Tax=Phytomonospora sp. NPDC050363 TaxID=3155642 RepID=UPI0033D379F0